MILREARLNREDCAFIASCYIDWPETKKGPVYEPDVRDWIRRWHERADEDGFIGEVGGFSVGVVFYTAKDDFAKIYEIAVPPAIRRMGHANAILRELQKVLVARGVMVAEFDALPGAISMKTERGDFEKIGEGIGEKTGLPLVKGRVTAGTVL